MTDELREAATFFYESCCLWEDEDLDPEDTLEVLKRAFMSSDCDAFAAVLAEMSGWGIVTMTWQIPNWGFGHHALVRAPGIGLLDITGWTDETRLRKAFGIGKATDVSFKEGSSLSPDADDEDAVAMIRSVIRNLPYAPFNETVFRQKLVDGPTVDDAPPT